MSQARLAREPKRQLGQFLTPPGVARAIVEQLPIRPEDRVLEPSFGTGAFLFALLDVLADRCAPGEAVRWARTRVHGCEIDASAFTKFATEWGRRGFGNIPENLNRGDFFRWLPPHCDPRAALEKRLYRAAPLESFDLVVGNPPFGGSFDPAIQDDLDVVFGVRKGMKIKKETYAFFLLKCFDLLKPGGRLCFICSDTILTIPTMRGLRRFLQEHCEIEISAVPGKFEETDQNLVLIHLVKHQGKRRHVRVFGNETRLADIEKTPNCSWRVNGEYARYFGGTLLGDTFVASSGMTTGNNGLFLREIVNGTIAEPYEFSFSHEPVTLAAELERARLGRISEKRRRMVMERERRGETRRVVSWSRREKPACLHIPHGDYRFYNKSVRDAVYAEPRWVIFWRDEGDYVYTYKKTGNWYLHGVGGKPFFGREGLTWSLIAPRLRTRWLPAGYILDSGAPCAFLKPGVERDELFLVMGWTLTELCTSILKNVINHTRNIQSKDFERLPYPDWVAPQARDDAIGCVKGLLRDAKRGRPFDFDGPGRRALDELYAWRAGSRRTPARRTSGRTLFSP